VLSGDTAFELRQLLDAPAAAAAAAAAALAEPASRLDRAALREALADASGGDIPRLAGIDPASRADEIAWVMARLATERALIVHGLRGAGKTTLARFVVAAWQRERRGAVAWLSLPAVR
jgi:hypothetical protein